MSNNEPWILAEHNNEKEQKLSIDLEMKSEKLIIV